MRKLTIVEVAEALLEERKIRLRMAGARLGNARSELAAAEVNLDVARNGVVAAEATLLACQTNEGTTP